MDRETARHNILIWDQLWGLPRHLRDRSEADPRLLDLAAQADGDTEAVLGPRPDRWGRAARDWDWLHMCALADLVARHDVYEFVRADLMQPDVYDMLRADHIVPLPDWDGWTPEEHTPPVIMTRPSIDGIMGT